MTEEPLKDKTATGLFWGGISNVVQQALGVVFGVYLARKLESDDYGLIAMLAIFTGIASTIINSGFTVALANKRDATHKDYNAVFWFTILMGTICYIILFFFAPLISLFYERQELTMLSRVIFVTFFFAGIGSVSQAILFKQLNVKKQAQIDIVAMLLGGITSVILATKGYAYWALAFQTVIYIGSGAILRFIVVPWKPTLEIDFSPLKGMFSFSSKLFLTNIFQQISSNFFSVLIGKFYNGGQLGYYSQGIKWTVMGQSTISGMITSVAQPALIESIDSLERQQNVFRKLVSFGSFVSFPALLGLAFVAKDFIMILLGEKWLPSVFFLQAFCVWGAIGFMNILYSVLLISHQKSNIYLLVSVAVGVLQLLVVLLVHPYGINIMVIGYILSSCLGLVMWQFFAKVYVKISGVGVLKCIIPYLAITLLSCSVAWVFTYEIENHYVVFFLKIAIVALLYLIIVWRGKSVIFREFINFLTKNIKR